MMLRGEDARERAVKTFASLTVKTLAPLVVKTRAQAHAVEDGNLINITRINRDSAQTKN